ncbi:hypothetical protein WKW80_05865 [Variovorax humicola]|uniref:Phage terminase small subunit n=1 Tax=Variovorax humicola TaxID=1769758 RepID=A0ABU8VUR9_9BURK
MSNTPDSKPSPNWEQIEADYRAGIKPLRLIAEENGVSHPAIRKRAKRDEWTRDLNAKIHAKADLLVSKASVPSLVSTETERQLVAANASLIAHVRIKHRGFIDRANNLVQVLFGDLECLSSPEGLGLIEVLTEAVNAPADETKDDQKKRRDKQKAAIDRAFALGERADISKKLVDQIVTLVNAERVAYGINDKTEAAEQSTGKVLTDAERASRIATIFAGLRARQAAAQLAEPQTVDDAA